MIFFFLSVHDNDPYTQDYDLRRLEEELHRLESEYQAMESGYHAGSEYGYPAQTQYGPYDPGYSAYGSSYPVSYTDTLLNPYGNYYQQPPPPLYTDPYPLGKVGLPKKNNCVKHCDLYTHFSRDTNRIP